MLLLTLMTLFWYKPQLMLMTMVFLQTLLKLCEAKQKAAMRKERLWQLLLQKNVMQATPTILVVAAPFSSAHFDTTTQRICHKAQHYSSRVDTAAARKKRQGKDSRHMTW